MTIKEINNLFDEVLDKVGELKEVYSSDLKYYSDRNIELLNDYNDLCDIHNYNVIFNFISIVIGFIIGFLVGNYC